LALAGHPALLLQVQAAFPLEVRQEGHQEVLVGSLAVERQQEEPQAGPAHRPPLLHSRLLLVCRRAIFLVHPRRLLDVDASVVYRLHLEGHRAAGHPVDRPVGHQEGHRPVDRPVGHQEAVLVGHLLAGHHQEGLLPS
jgi:hypothetical protein